MLKGAYMMDGRSWKSITTLEESANFYIPNIKVPAELSVCVRYFLEFKNGGGWLMIWTKNLPICSLCPGVQLQANTHRPKFGVMDADKIYFTKGTSGFRENVIRKWNSMCWSFDFREANHTLQIAWNGQLTEVLTAAGSQELPWGWNYDRTEPGLNLTLAKYWRGRYMIGKFVDFNLWDRRLTEDEMLKYTDCKKYHQPKGNLMNGNDTWLHNNEFIKNIEISWDEVQCSEKNNFTTAPIAELQESFKAANNTCNKLETGSFQPEILSQKDYDSFYWTVRNNSAFKDLVPKGKGECWWGGRLIYKIPYIELDDASGFVHHITGELLRFPYWVYWYPGPRLARAPIVDSNRTSLVGYWDIGGEYNKTFIAWDMTDEGCVACKIEHSFEKNTFLKMRGLCSLTYFDETYVPRFKDGFIMYYGEKSTVIEYNVDKKTWFMYRSYDPTVIAESQATYGSLVIGNHLWQISNDSECDLSTVRKTITLTSCSADDYTCDDGLCIDISLRCNGDNDCDDKSDEINCRKLSIDKSYAKHFSPPPYGTISNVDKVFVNVSTTILLIQGNHC
jgi:hypothetical protein